MKLKVCCMAFLTLLFNCLYGQGEGYSKWIAQHEALKQDTRVERYYTFEDVKDSNSVIKEIKGSGADLVFVPYREGDKIVDDLKVIEGRVEGKTAVRLDRGWYQSPAFDMKKKQFTLSVWFRRQGPGSIPSASLADEGAVISVAGWDRGWRIATVYDNFNTLRFCLGQPGGCEMVTSNISIPDNLWHHLAVTWDGREMFIYFNGILVGKKEFIGSYNPALSGDVLRLGYAGDSTGSVVLDIDELAIYNSALSSGDIRGLAQASSSPANAVFQTADTCIKEGDYNGARREYEKLKGMKSVEYGRELALFNIAESYRLEKDYDNAHKTYKEIFAITGLTPYYRIYGLFRQAEVYMEQGKYENSRRLYADIPKIEGTLEHHLFKAALFTGDSYRSERKYEKARAIYRNLLKHQKMSPYPHEEYMLEIVDRLYIIEGLADGQEEKSLQEKRAGWVNSPEFGIYVSPQGKDTNPGTKERPFATIERAREEVRKIKREKGMPEGGIAVYLREGKYFITESVVFEEEDSGKENAPVVYRSYPGEEVRITGGKEIVNFKPLSDPDIIRMLPADAKDKVWVSDLKAAGINKYGKLVNRGNGPARPGAMELFYNNMPMQLSRWPDEEWLFVSDLVTPGGDGGSGAYVFQKGRFRYTGDRPKRWNGEKDIWIAGFFNRPWHIVHTQVIHIDMEERIIHLAPDIRWFPSYNLYDMPVVKDMPYYFYNILGEISSPGEFYVDRDTGKLYFYPPAGIKDGEVIVSTLDAPLIKVKGTSNLVLFGLTMECNWQNGIEIKEGKNVLIAGSTIRNTGQNAVNIDGGWRNSVVGCDMYAMGEGGVLLEGGNREYLVSSGHCVENNHIHSFNRFDRGYRPAVSLGGIGHRVSHNLISDSPHQAVRFDYNDHVIEFNEIYDVVHEARDAGAVYLYGEPRYLLNRGNILRYNFIHHVTEHSSAVPYANPGINCIYIDALNAGVTMVGNILYRCTGTAVFTHGADSRLENSVFVDNRLSIHQGDRSSILKNRVSRKRWEDNMLTVIRHKQPPWASRYPQLRNIEKYENVGLPRNTVNERNINTGGEFLKEYASFQENKEILESYLLRNNLDGCDPLFVNTETLNFKIRPGSPVHGITGFDTLPFEKIGLYEDPLRASWPVKKSEAGKYYKKEKLAFLPSAVASFPELSFKSKMLVHEVKRRVSPIRVDGKLETGEWAGLDRSRAIIVEDIIYPRFEEPRKGDRIYAWLAYDDKYLYIAVENTPNPFKPGMTEKEKYPASVLNEISIEGIHDEKTWWWQRNIKTGPVYVFSGHYNGRLDVANIFMMPRKAVEYLKEAIEYKTVILDEENYHWTAEWKIPFAALNINPEKVNTTRFNIGASRRGGWLAWVPTGGSAWRLDNGGKLKFIK